MAEIIEKFDSRGSSGGTTTYKYAVFGTIDPDEVDTLVLATAPEEHNGSPRGLHSKNAKFDFWEVSVPYSASEASFAPSGNGAGEDPGPIGEQEGGGNPAGEVSPAADLGREISFSTGGGTQRLYQSLETVARYAPAGKVAPNHARGINVKGNEVGGVDVIAPSGVVTIGRKIETMTVGYFLRLLAMTATTNDKPYKGFGRCELLLAGADGNYQDNDGWKLSCKFNYERSDFNETIGDGVDLNHSIFNVEKLGHHYMWTESELVEDTNANPARMVLRPFAVHVERVYKESDFDVLGL